MKGSLFFGLFLSYGLSAFAADSSSVNFQGATAQPAGQIEESITQFRVRFPSTMIKKDAFKVECSPKVDGFGSWADNDTLWTYNFKAKNQDETPKLIGGAKCDVVQTADLASADSAKIWKSGTIKYSIEVAGPNVTDVIVANDFNGSLRESQATVMIVFNGPVNKASFFSHQNAYLNYLSSNAPGEKIAMVPVPPSEEATLFAYFKSSSYFDADLKGQNWILATVKQNLIPGSSLTLHVENQVSALNPTVHAVKPYTQKLTVRSRFEAKVSCQNPSSSNSVCLPNTPIDIELTGRVKWPDIKDAYIEYIPYKSKDRKIVRSYPQMPAQPDSDSWSVNSIINKVAQYVPYAAKFSDTLVQSVSFNVNIEPQTQAKIVIPSQLKDIDGRKLTNPIAEFKLRIGAMTEAIQLPQPISFFEKNVSTLYMAAGVVNLNQTIVVRKTGSDKNRWQPVTDIKTMIQLLRAYEVMGGTRNTPDYTSPMEALGLASNRDEQKLSGTKNRDIFLQFPFGKNGDGQVGGFYPIEISSPTMDAQNIDPKNNIWPNPQYVLGQVTNLAVHMKKGANSSIAWVTSLSDGKPVAGAQVEIYNCLGELKKTMTTDASGLAYFDNASWAQTCDAPKQMYSDLFRPENYYVAAKAGGDQTLIHSSWLSSNSYAMSAPGVDYFYSGLQEGQPNFHSVIGVNLVKPGQTVPVQIFAKFPNARGFSEVNPSQLPAKVRVVNAEDDNVFYEFPLKWDAGTAAFSWTVPADSSVKIGRYAIQLIGAGQQDRPNLVLPEDIEVAEFKVPLMSGVISFPNQPLVQPDSIPVSSVVRYANGVGAKNMAMEISYFFHPTSMEVKALPEFSFGTGPASLADDDSNDTDNALPTRDRPTTIEALKAGADGSLTRDLAAEKVSDGRSVADVIKSLNRPQTMVVRVRYQDQMGEYQTLSKAKDIFNAAKYVGTSLKAGDRSSAQLRAAMVDVSGNILTSLDDLQLKIVRIESKIIGEEIFGGMVKNTIERQLQPTRWDSSSCQMAKGAVTCSVGALKEGTYAFEVTSKSSEQAAHVTFKVDSSGNIYGKGDYYQFGDQDGNKALPLALNKDSYQDGEKAVVSFPSPFKTCSTLVSIERADVIQAYVVNDACSKGNVQVPVDGTLAPNAFVSVFAVTGRAPMQQKAKLGDTDFGRPTYRLGFANMKVNWSHFKSDVAVATDKPVYKPGDNITVQVNVAANEGSLTKGTVTLVAIEEKILELKPNDTYSILDALMQLRGHSVETVTPLERIQTVVAKNADMPSAGRKGGNEGGDGSSKSEFKRKLFDALVLFQPNIPVVNGQASFTFKANDSVTKFKIFAIASDASQKFGTGSVEYLTQQDTQSYSNIPTVSHNGDNYPLLVTVQNNGAAPVNYTVRATVTVHDASGKVIDSVTFSQQASIENAGSQAVNLGSIRIGDDAASISYGIKIYDEKGNVVDSMEPPVQVVQPSVPLAVHDSFIYQMDASNSFTRSLTKEADALPNKGEIRVSVSKSLVGGGLDQIVARINRDTFADFFIESRIYKAMLNSSASNTDALSKVLAALIGFTDNNGYIKYVPENRSGSLWLTATILNNLQTESWTMPLMPPAVKQKLKVGIQKVLDKSVDPQYIGTSPSPMDWFRARVAMARAAYAFNDKDLRSAAAAVYQNYAAQLRGNPAALGETLDKWSNEDLLNFWLLEVSASPSTAKTSAIYAQMTQPSRLVYTGNMAQISGSPSYSFFYNDETISAGQLLYGHSVLKMDANLARALAEGLINKSTGGWYVNETLISVAEGLRAFAKAYEMDAVSGVATVQVPDEHATTTVNWDQSDVGNLVSPWTAAKSAVQVSQSGQGRPWVAIQALSAVPLKAARGQGLSVEKSIHNISRDSGYQAGDIIEVTLNISASSAVNHVAVNDPIPAGANILDGGLSGYDSGEKSYSGYKFYFGQLPLGLTTVKYQYQLNNPGTFNMPPTRAEGLYMPGVYGEAPNASMTVQ